MKPVHGDDGWQMVAEASSAFATKEVSEGPASGAAANTAAATTTGDVPQPQKVVPLPKGTMLDTFALSPDGSQIVYVVLLHKEGSDVVRSQMRMVRVDGSGGETLFGDDRSLDVMPSFTPDGSQIVFASNRAGRHMRIWQMSAAGEPGISQFPGEEGESDLWPDVDADSKPRLFYEVLLDSRPDARLYTTVLGTQTKTDLTCPAAGSSRASAGG